VAEAAPFFQKERTAIGQGKAVPALPGRAGDGASLMTEAFASPQTRWNGGTVDPDQPLVPPIAVGMNGTDTQFLAVADFTELDFRQKTRSAMSLAARWRCHMPAHWTKRCHATFTRL